MLALNQSAFPSDWTPWITLAHEECGFNQIHGKFGDDSSAMYKAVSQNNPAVVWADSPVTYLPGYTAETARDLGHVEVSFAAEINAAEIAWHQGVDVYTPQTERLTTFMEMEAGLRLGEPPSASMTAPLVPYGLVATFEIAFNHYADRDHRLPDVREILQILRAAGVDAIKPVGQDPANPRLWSYTPLWKSPPPFPSLFASDIGGSVGWISSWETLTHAGLGN